MKVANIEDEPLETAGTAEDQYLWQHKSCVVVVAGTVQVAGVTNNKILKEKREEKQRCGTAQ